jgi:hypothetical protein
VWVVSIPLLAFGSAEGGGLMVVGEGFTDAGLAYEAVARSNPAAPETIGEQAVYPAIRLALQHREEAGPEVVEPDTHDFTVAALVDGNEVATSTFRLSLAPVTDVTNPPRRVLRVYWVPFSYSRLEGGTEVGTERPSGTLFQLELRWPGSDVAVDHALVEYDTKAATLVPVTLVET